MRTAEELKRLAYDGAEPVESETSPAELCFWVTMLHIYKMHAAGQLDISDAKRLTGRAESMFKELSLWERCYKTYTDREIKAEMKIAAYRTFKTEENKEALIDALLSM